MSLDNTETGIGRRRLLKASGGVLAGGFALGSVASSASASTNPDLNLESDFEQISSKRSSGTTGGKYVDATIGIYRPKLSTDLVRSDYRVAKVELDINSGEPEHLGARIVMDGKNGAYLESEAVGPGNTIPSTSTTYSVGFESSTGGDATLTTSASQGITKSALHIDDNSDIQNEEFRHLYDFGGGLENNHMTIDGLAIFRTYNAEESDDIIDIDWNVFIDRSFVDHPSDSYTYTYYGGNLD